MGARRAFVESRSRGGELDPEAVVLHYTDANEEFVRVAPRVERGVDEWPPVGPPALLALPLGPSNALSLGPGFVGPEYGFAASAEAGIADESPDHGSLLAPPLRLPPSSDMPLFPALRLDRARAEATRVLALRDSEREVTGTSHGSAHHNPLRPRRQPPPG